MMLLRHLMYVRGCCMGIGEDHHFSDRLQTEALRGCPTILLNLMRILHELTVNYTKASASIVYVSVIVHFRYGCNTQFALFLCFSMTMYP